MKKLYKTVWEISQRTLIDMVADRGAYIDQSQSFNVHIAEPNFGKLTSMHFYAWKKASHMTVMWSVTELFLLCVQGLKTGMYYLRTKPAADAIQFTVDQDLVHKVREAKRSQEAGKQDENSEQAAMACSLQNKEACLMCSS